MPFVAFLDANVLYPAALRDVLLTLAEAGVCQIRWSPDVLDEVERNLAARARAPEPSVAAAGARYVRSVMEDAFPDAMVPREAYERLIPTMTNDPKDRHVMAAAVAGRADVIVTFNVSDFPAAACQPYGIEVQDPDTFLVHQFGLMPERIAQVLTELAAERRPPMDTPEGILRVLERMVPRFCAMARERSRGG